MDGARQPTGPAAGREGGGGALARVIWARGPRAAEAHLVAEVRRDVARVRARPERLVSPLRIVVPSSSLREHVASRLVRALGGGVAGVSVQTLHALALEVIERAGEGAVRGDDLFPVLVRRCARREPALRAVLDGLEDGYGAVAAAVSDLLDAGFAGELAAHREALAEGLGAAGLAADVRARGEALARTAASAAAELERLGVARRGGRLARAAALVEADPECLPSRGVLVHGFADATGVASDLLQVLARRLDATLLFDEPPDPARPERADLGAAFGERLLSRWGVGPRPAAEVAADPRPERPRLAVLRAAGTEAEVRGVGDRVHALLAAGTAPEQIGVVARQLSPYAVALRTHFGRLGIPFSGRQALGPPAGGGRRLHALLDLLVRGPATPADRWLEVLARGRELRADLRLGLHALGAARLRDVAGIDVAARLDAHGSLPLPARLGLASAAPGTEGDAGRRPRRRRLSQPALGAVVEAAAAACARLEGWPRSARLSGHRAALDALVEGALGWRAGPERGSLDELLGASCAELPDLELAFDEFVLLLRRSLARSGGDRLGGAGAGVQVLSVVEARGRSFDALFLLGVNRDAFPRPLVEDPLLPETVRRGLESILPEIPLKARGFEEEHYLFAQLLASSPQVTLAWQVADDDGRARSASPFVERLRSAGVELPREDAPTLQAPPERASGRPRTAQECAVTEGLHGSPRRFGQLFALALRERELRSPVAAEPLARARLAVLGELADRPGRDRLGPYFGFVGTARDARDLRSAELYVTQVERLLRCPWQVFLTRLLGLEPPPDALDSLPEATPLLVGGLVHLVLQRAVEAVVPPEEAELPEAPAARGVPVPWPEPAALEALLEACAEQLVRSEGIAAPGFARLLAEAARPLVAAAREQGWPSPDSGVVCVGAERRGRVEAAGRTIWFRADRVDAVDGTLRVVDYKTGKRPRARPLDGVASGASLQAAAYAFGSGGEGRYVYLRSSEVVSVGADDEEIRGAFDRAVGVALEAFERGSFVPRLTDAEEKSLPRHCEWCDVRQACLQGDGSARLRLRAWAEAGRGRTPAERAALALWQLPEAGA